MRFLSVWESQGIFVVWHMTDAYDVAIVSHQRRFCGIRPQVTRSDSRIRDSGGSIGLDRTRLVAHLLRWRSAVPQGSLSQQLLHPRHRAADGFGNAPLADSQRCEPENLSVPD